MTPENFVYWLQGMIEIGDPATLSREQIQIIRDHIALVLKKETPPYINRNDDIFPKGLPYKPGIWINKNDIRDDVLTCSMSDRVSDSLNKNEWAKATPLNLRNDNPFLVHYSDVAGSC